MVRSREEVTGVLLVGGASTRFGSPKPLAVFAGEPLAERAHRMLEDAFGRVVALGKKGDELRLPFPVRDDGSDERAPIVGVAAALLLAETDLCIVVPTDLPYVTPELLLELAAGAEGVDAAVPQTGPLPGGYRKSALPVLERRIAAGDLALHRALSELRTRVVEVDEEQLLNVNSPAELEEAEGRRGRSS